MSVIDRTNKVSIQTILKNCNNGKRPSYNISYEYVNETSINE